MFFVQFCLIRICSASLVYVTVLYSVFLVFIVSVIIVCISLALEGIHRRQIKPVRVFTCSQGNLEAKGNLRR